MSDRLSNEYGHDISEKAESDDTGQAFDVPAVTDKESGAPAPNLIPSNEGGTADTLHDHSHT